MKIMNPIKGLIDYEPYQYQKELIDLLLSGRNVIVKSSRQMGVSTTLIYCIRELCLTKPGYKALIHCVHDDYAKLFCKILQQQKDNFEEVSEYQIEYKNGSIVRFISSGRKFNNVKPISGFDRFYDLYEYQNHENLKHLEDNFLIDCNDRFYSFTGINTFHNDGFVELKWNWDLNPHWDQDWFEDQLKILGEKIINKEYIVK